MLLAWDCQIPGITGGFANPPGAVLGMPPAWDCQIPGITGGFANPPGAVLGMSPAKRVEGDAADLQKSLIYGGARLTCNHIPIKPAMTDTFPFVSTLFKNNLKQTN